MASDPDNYEIKHTAHFICEATTLHVIQEAFAFKKDRTAAKQILPEDAKHWEFEQCCDMNGHSWFEIESFEQFNQASLDRLGHTVKTLDEAFKTIVAGTKAEKLQRV